MLVERGIHAQNLRIRLMLQSEDVDTHGAMTDNWEVMNELADFLGEAGRRKIEELVPLPVEHKR